MEMCCIRVRLPSCQCSDVIDTNYIFKVAFYREWSLFGDCKLMISAPEPAADAGFADFADFQSAAPTNPGL